jgi:hypothetical protein
MSTAGCQSQSWNHDEFDLVLAALEQLADTLTPAPEGSAHDSLSTARGTDHGVAAGGGPYGTANGARGMNVVSWNLKGDGRGRNGSWL